MSCFKSRGLQCSIVQQRRHIGRITLLYKYCLYSAASFYDLINSQRFFKPCLLTPSHAETASKEHITITTYVDWFTSNYNLLNIVHIFRHRCLIIRLIKLRWSPASKHKYLCFGCLCRLSVCVPNFNLDTILNTADQWRSGIQLTILVDSEIRSTWNCHNKNEWKDFWLYLDVSRQWCSSV